MEVAVAKGGGGGPQPAGEHGRGVAVLAHVVAVAAAAAVVYVHHPFRPGVEEGWLAAVGIAVDVYAMLGSPLPGVLFKVERLELQVALPWAALQKTYPVHKKIETCLRNVQYHCTMQQEKCQVPKRVITVFHPTVA